MLVNLGTSSVVGQTVREHLQPAAAKQQTTQYSLWPDTPNQSTEDIRFIFHFSTALIFTLSVCNFTNMLQRYRPWCKNYTIMFF